VPVIRSMSRGETPTHPVLRSPGWWRRAERLLYADATVQALGSDHGRPLLILGANGTLGRAFRRIAAERGLASVHLGRNDADITNAVTIQEAIARVDPSSKTIWTVSFPWDFPCR